MHAFFVLVKYFCTSTVMSPYAFPSMEHLLKVMIFWKSWYINFSYYYFFLIFRWIVALIKRQYSFLQSDYLSQCSRFIWKDVLNLPKLFIQGCGFCVCWCIRFLIIHFNIPVNHQALCKSDTFHTINKRNFHYEWFYRSRYFWDVFSG